MFIHYKSNIYCCVQYVYNNLTVSVYLMKTILASISLPFSAYLVAVVLVPVAAGVLVG